MLSGRGSEDNVRSIHREVEPMPKGRDCSHPNRQPQSDVNLPRSTQYVASETTSAKRRIVTQLPRLHTPFPVEQWALRRDAWVRGRVQMTTEPGVLVRALGPTVRPPVWLPREAESTSYGLLKISCNSVDRTVD